MTPRQIQEHWAEIVDTMNDGLMLISPDGTIELVNKALSKMTGYTKEEIVGHYCTIFNCDACERVRVNSNNWCRLFDSEQDRQEQCHCHFRTKKGGSLPILKNAAILRDAQGKILGAVETITDLSELQQKDQQIEELSRRLTAPDNFCGMIGRSAIMHSVFSLIDKAANSMAPVLILGESGSGKELVARSIHTLSQRKNESFIQLNCAALNESLLESELFGHVKGAFTGAYRYRKGRFEAANKGSIFLDEIGEMPVSSQVKLLRVLDTMQVERVGDHQPIKVDVRVIAATNRNLPELIHQSRFREDLFFRLNVIPIHLPSLRERLEDIPPLVDSIIQAISEKTGKAITGLSPSSLSIFMNYAWPGNVRELKSALEYACVVADSGLIEPNHLPGHLLNKPTAQIAPINNRESVMPEKTALIAALNETKGNKSAAARLLGVSRGTIWNRMNKYGLQKREEIWG